MEADGTRPAPEGRAGARGRPRAFPGGWPQAPGPSPSTRRRPSLSPRVAECFPETSGFQPQVGRLSHQRLSQARRSPELADLGGSERVARRRGRGCREATGRGESRASSGRGEVAWGREGPSSPPPPGAGAQLLSGFTARRRWLGPEHGFSNSRRRTRSHPNKGHPRRRPPDRYGRAGVCGRDPRPTAVQPWPSPAPALSSFTQAEPGVGVAKVLPVGRPSGQEGVRPAD